MNRHVASFAALAFFAALNVGTSKAPPPGGSPATSAAPAVSKSGTAPEAVGPAPPPGWHTARIEKPDVEMSLPPKWRAGSFGDGSFSVIAPPDSNANFIVPKVSVAARIDAQIQEWNRLKDGTVFLHEPDAVFAHVKLGHPVIEGVVCGKAGAKDYCAAFLEADPPGGTAEADARAMLQVARSMRAP